MTRLDNRSVSLAGLARGESDAAGEDAAYEFDREPHPEAAISDSMRVIRLSISISDVGLGIVRLCGVRTSEDTRPCLLPLLALNWCRGTRRPAIEAIKTAFALFFTFYLSSLLSKSATYSKQNIRCTFSLLHKSHEVRRFEVEVVGCG